MMTLDHRFHQLQTLRQGLSLLIAPLQYLVDLPLRMLQETGETLTTREHLLKENRRLHTENLLLHARLQKLEALERENTRLRGLIQAAGHVPDAVTIAEIMAVDLDTWRQQVVIDRGSRDGVFVGQPVLDANGVMGQVVSVSPLTATVLLITDPSHALPVQVNRNGLRTLVVGTGQPDRLEVRFVPTSADVRVGDVLSTSGLGGRFPPDYPVAEITRVAHPPGEAFARIEARPLAHIDRSREILLVLSHHQPAADPAPEADAGDTPPPGARE